VPAGQLLEAATAMAEIIAANAPLSVRASKQAVEVATEVGQTAALAAAHQLFYRVYTSEDAAEGPRAFAEKRKPVWTGR
jgi:enoyl-CoA hydratase